MSVLTTAAGPGLWGSGLNDAATAARVAERATAQAAELGAAWTEAGAASLDGVWSVATAPALLALGIGLGLWLVGDRLFRPASSLIGAALGALLGLAANGMLEAETVAGVPAAYATIGGGSLLGLAVGAALYRLAVGAAGGAVMGLAAAVLVVAATVHAPDAGDAAGGPDEQTVAEAAAADPTPAEPAARIIPASFTTGDAAEQLGDAAASAGAWAEGVWASVPDQTRPLALAGAILGGLIGFGAGLVRPRTVGPAVAALAGAALWLGATTALLARTGETLPPLPTQEPGGWLIGWFLVAIVGFAVQRRMIRPPAAGGEGS